MTVRELIEKLKDCPQDAPVGTWAFYLHEVESLSIETERRDNPEGETEGETVRVQVVALSVGV